MFIYWGKGWSNNPKMWMNLTTLLNWNHIWGAVDTLKIISQKSVPFCNECSKTFNMAPGLLRWNHFNNRTKFLEGRPFGTN